MRAAPRVLRVCLRADRRPGARSAVQVRTIRYCRGRAAARARARAEQIWLGKIDTIYVHDMYKSSVATVIKSVS